MTWEIRDWRALAMGYGAGLLIACLFGVTWYVPVVAIAAAVICRYAWR